MKPKCRSNNHNNTATTLKLITQANEKETLFGSDKIYDTNISMSTSILHWQQINICEIRIDQVYIVELIFQLIFSDTNIFSKN